MSQNSTSNTELFWLWKCRCGQDNTFYQEFIDSTTANCSCGLPFQWLCPICNNDWQRGHGPGNRSCNHVRCMGKFTPLCHDRNGKTRRGQTFPSPKKQRVSLPRELSQNSGLSTAETPKLLQRSDHEEAASKEIFSEGARMTPYTPSSNKFQNWMIPELHFSPTEEFLPKEQVQHDDISNSAQAVHMPKPEVPTSVQDVQVVPQEMDYDELAENEQRELDEYNAKHDDELAENEQRELDEYNAKHPMSAYTYTDSEDDTHSDQLYSSAKRGRRIAPNQMYATQLNNSRSVEQLSMDSSAKRHRRIASVEQLSMDSSAIRGRRIAPNQICATPLDNSGSVEQLSVNSSGIRDERVVQASSFNSSVVTGTGEVVDLTIGTDLLTPYAQLDLSLVLTDEPSMLQITRLVVEHVRLAMTDTKLRSLSSIYGGPFIPFLQMIEWRMFMTLEHGKWIASYVIDVLIDLCKERKTSMYGETFVLSCAEMLAIVNPSNARRNGKSATRLPATTEAVCGVFNTSIVGAHWVLVVMRNTGQLVVYNPTGGCIPNVGLEPDHIVKLKNYMLRFMSVHEVQVETDGSRDQRDYYNCGIHCMIKLGCIFNLWEESLQKYPNAVRLAFAEFLFSFYRPLQQMVV